MNYRIKALPDFARTLKRLSKKYHSIKQDYAKLLEELYANPQAGIDLGSGLRKVLENKFLVPSWKTSKAGRSRFCIR